MSILYVPWKTVQVLGEQCAMRGGPLAISVEHPAWLITSSNYCCSLVRKLVVFMERASWKTLDSNRRPSDDFHFRCYVHASVGYFVVDVVGAALW